jgi:hypothetical protein
MFGGMIMGAYVKSHGGVWLFPRSLLSKLLYKGDLLSRTSQARQNSPRVLMC